MKFFEEHYYVNGWRNSRYSLTAKELYDRVMDDCKSDYNWIASATELVRVCNQPGFPAFYADQIKIAILNCFASLETKRDGNSYGEPTDDEAVQSCYHSLPRNKEEAINAKKNYLAAVIRGVTMGHFEFPIHSGSGTYARLVKKWREEKLEQYVSEKEIDFNKLRKELHKEFEEFIQAAENEGAFDEDDKKRRQEMSEFFESFADKI